MARFRLSNLKVTFIHCISLNILLTCVVLLMKVSFISCLSLYYRPRIILGSAISNDLTHSTSIPTKFCYVDQMTETKLKIWKS